MTLTACFAAPSTPAIITPTPVVSDIMPNTPVPSVEVQVREALQESNPGIRLVRTLDAVEAFLLDSNIRAVNDNLASRYLTDAAFSSERLIFADPVLVRRRGDLAVVALPNAMGLYLFNLTPDQAYPPVELSPWTAGISTLNVTWGNDEVGTDYITLGADGITRVHFILARRDDEAWRVAWFSDENPDWWFNALDAVIAVAADLSQVSVVGEAQGTTVAFIEEDDAPRRRFQLDWIREGDTYQVHPSLANRQLRQEWLWSVAQPGTYTTLVEFVERLRIQDEEGASHLVASPALITTAHDLGLDWQERRYEVLIYDQTRIVFGDRIALYVVTLQPPVDSTSPWLIIDLQPLGAVLPTPTPIIAVP